MILLLILGFVGLGQGHMALFRKVFPINTLCSNCVTVLKYRRHIRIGR